MPVLGASNATLKYCPKNSLLLGLICEHGKEFLPLSKSHPAYVFGILRLKDELWVNVTGPISMKSSQQIPLFHKWFSAPKGWLIFKRFCQETEESYDWLGFLGKYDWPVVWSDSGYHVISFSRVLNSSSNDIKFDKESYLCLLAHWVGLKQMCDFLSPSL